MDSAKTSFEHLLNGGIYSILLKQDGQDFRARYVLAKIVHLTPQVVHLVIFDRSFAKRPTLSDVTLPNMALPEDIEEARARHMAVSRKLFSLMRPIYITKSDCTPMELAGWRQWQFMEDQEVMKAPESFPSSDNFSVYKRIFLMTGVPAAFLQAAVFYYHDGPIVGLIAFLITLPVFGLGMVATQRMAVKRKLKQKLAGSKAEVDADDIKGSMSAFQMEEIAVPLTFESAYRLCKKAIYCVKNVKILEQDEQTGTIEAEVPPTLAYEGESVTISLFQLDQDQCGVVVSSVPRSGGEIDMGRNMGNVMTILNVLKDKANY